MYWMCCSICMLYYVCCMCIVRVVICVLYVLLYTGMYRNTSIVLFCFGDTQSDLAVLIEALYNKDRNGNQPSWLHCVSFPHWGYCVYGCSQRTTDIVYIWKCNQIDRSIIWSIKRSLIAQLVRPFEGYSKEGTISTGSSYRSVEEEYSGSSRLVRAGQRPPL